MSVHFCARCSILSYMRCNSVSIDTAELHRVYDNMLQRAQKCTDVQRDHFQYLLSSVSTLHLHSFNFLYRVPDLRPRWSTRWRAGFSCASLYYNNILENIFISHSSTYCSKRFAKWLHYHKPLYCSTHQFINKRMCQMGGSSFYFYWKKTRFFCES